MRTEFHHPIGRQAEIVGGIGRGFGGSPVTVIGYGPVGEGVAQHVRALGGDVTVVETDPVRELEARSAGYATGPAASASIPRTCASGRTCSRFPPGARRSWPSSTTSVPLLNTYLGVANISA